MSARSLVIGMDGADLEVVLALGREQLPELFALMDRGVFAHQWSAQPPATLPNWTTFLTALDPGRHGVFDFTVRKGYAVEFRAGTVREAPTWIARLDRSVELRVRGFLATWPPEKLAHGVFISGWDAPVAFEADASSCGHASCTRLCCGASRPCASTRSINSGPTNLVFMQSSAKAWSPRSKLARISRVSCWPCDAGRVRVLLRRERHGLPLFVESPRRGSPRRPALVSEAERRGLTAVYRQLDRALGRLVREAGPNVEVTVVSDYGSGGSSDKVVYLNRAFASLGLLHFKARPRQSEVANGAQALGPRKTFSALA